MLALLSEPFFYLYMRNALFVATLVGALCAFLSCFLMMKGWSLIGDALSHSVVPGVVGAYMIGLPFSFGAFVAGGLAMVAILFLNTRTGLRQDTIIGVVFTAFFALGLFMISLSPVSVNVQAIILGNILAIAPIDMIQLVLIGFGSLAFLSLKWRDFMLTFFDEVHARSVGLPTRRLRVIFFTILALSIVAALQTVGAFLVIAMVITPGATAFLLTDRFARLLIISVALGAGSGFLGTYISYFINGAAGGIIVLLQVSMFLIAFCFAPKYGWLMKKFRTGQNPQTEGLL